MYVVILRYTAALEAIDALHAEHRSWLGDQYAAGRFLLSGPQRPRTGGVILAGAMPRAELDELLAADPFARAGAATYEVVEFAPVLSAERLIPLRELP
ncbi:MAG TPA: YciI family protein [Azospirillaceae bacterium]|nr:YciI family protein [Azospirillaceae bacterium]